MGLPKPSEHEMKALYEDLAERVRMADNGRAWWGSAQENYNEGAKEVLGWILGEEDRPDFGESR